MAAATNPNPNMPGLDGYDDSGHQTVKIRAKNVTIDSSVTPNVTVGDLGVDVEISVETTGSSAGGIALTSPPANTNVGADTALTFSQKVNRFLIQNNTSANCYVELDAAATTGSVLLAPGIIWTELIQVTVPHVYTAAAQPVNAANGIIVRGWI